MEIIKGQFTEAKVFSDDMEQYARAQLQMICDNETSKGSIIRVMPDVHPGMVGPIGLTMTISDKIIPNLLGIDIGCGMSCTVLEDKNMEFQKLDKVIMDNIPSGFRLRGHIHHKAEEFDIERLYCFKHINYNKTMLSLGTLGGGNHFIEVDKGSKGELNLVVHSGSRRLGKEVTEYYINEGQKELKEKGIEVPYPMTYLEGELIERYIHDVAIVQEFAQLNREIISYEIIKGMKLKVRKGYTFSSVHNYIDTETMILRKGAISAGVREKVIIPINMRDGVILGVGLGNEDWNKSAPHGSGRLIRRSEVKDKYTVSSFKKEMKGIYSSCVRSDTLDESPFAYRSLNQILDSRLSETVYVLEVAKPVYNFKAGGKD